MHRTVVVTSALFLWLTPASATSVLKLDTQQITTRAELIVHARCESTDSRSGPAGAIVTDVAVQAIEVLKGTVEHDRFTFTIYGGIVGNRGSAISGAPIFREGEEMVVFLSKVGNKGWRTVIGLAQGKYSVRMKDGKKLAYRNLQGLRLVDPKTNEEEEVHEEDQGVPLAELLERVKRCLQTADEEEQR